MTLNNERRVAFVPVTRRLGFDLLRILSICGVVSIHTFGAIGANSELVGTPGWGAAVLMSSGFVWAVPVFVMLSGALSLTERAHSAGPASFLRKRARRIIPAIVAWHLIYLFVIRMLLLNEDISLWQGVNEVVFPRVYPHLYFLWLIAGLYCVAPVIASFLRDGGKKRSLTMGGTVLGVTLVVYMVHSVLLAYGITEIPRFTIFTFWIPYVGYFIIGFALSRITVTRKALFALSAVIAVTGALILLQAGLPSYFTGLSRLLVPDYLGIGVAMLAMSVFVVCTTLFDHVQLNPRWTRLVVKLSEASFGVYLVHFVVLLIPYSLLPGFSGQTSFFEASLAYVFILIASFAISLTAQRIPYLRAIF